MLAGIDAAVSTAASGGGVEATTGTVYLMVSGDVNIEATNESDQFASATGVAASGVLAIGADVAAANSDVTTLAQALLGAGSMVADTLNITATGTDENDASSTGGSGGFVAGDVSVGDTNDNSTVSAEIGGTVMAAHREHQRHYQQRIYARGKLCERRGRGASGALADNVDTISATTMVDDDTQIMALLAVNLRAQNTFTEYVPPTGNTVSAGAGGFVNGTAAVSTTTLTSNALVTIGGGVVIDVEDASSPTAATASS